MSSSTVAVSEGTAKGLLWRWLAAIVLGVVGFSFAWFRWEVNLFFNVDFTFGSLFVLLTFLFCGTRYGVAAGAIAYSSSFVVSHHPWGFVLFMGEVLFIAALGRGRSRNVVVLVTLYWATIGASLIWVLYHHVMGMPAQSALVFMSKQLVNSVFNALFATIVFLAAAALGREPDSLPSFRSLVFTVLLALSLTPVLALMVMNVREKFNAGRQAAVDLVEQATGMTRSALAEWLREQLLPIETLAQLVDPGKMPRDVMQQHVETMKRLSPQLLHMGVIDARSVTVAYSPAVDETGRSNIGVDLSDRPYARFLRERRRSFVPDLLIARVGRPRPVQVLFSPIVTEGQYRGYCSGIVDPSYLKSLIRSVAGDDPVQITLLDRTGHIVASTKKGLQMMEPFPGSAGGDVIDQGGGVHQWVPRQVGVSRIQRWWNSYFVKELPSTDDLPWKIVVEASAAPMLISLNRFAIKQFLLMAFVVIFGVVVSHLVSRGLAESLGVLQRNTEQLHRKITAGLADLSWPKSRMSEVKGLVSNFRDMADALQGSFSELRGLNETLERRVAERTKEIREREENFRVLFEQAADSILLFELVPDGIPIIRDANAATFAQLGYDREEMIGKPVTLLDPDPEILEKTRERQQRVSEGGTARFEVQHRRKDGSVRILQCAASLVQVGGKRMILSTERDVTEFRLAETERVRLQDQLREAQKREAIGTLAGGIAHDFNNILTPLIGHAELALLRMADDDPARDHISQLLVSAERASDLVRQILAISRREEKSELAPVTLEPLVKETIRFLRATIPVNVEIRMHLEPGCPPVVGGVGQLQQVLINLCANGRDALQEKGGVLEVAVEPWGGPGEGRWVRLSVCDSGAGIPPEIVERIFDPYFTTKAKGKGTGLGLAVTQGIVTALGGRIQVKSEVGKGSTFEVLLPAAEGQEVQVVPEPQRIPQAQGRHVLVVDDEEAIRGVLAEMLPALGYRVTACANAEEALALVRSESDDFDAVLTDYTMPGMLGLDLARELLRMRPGLPVLIGTGCAEGVDEGTARAAGLSGFVAKPYGLQRLSEALGRALEGVG